jgi:hypothetical protein
MASFSDFTTEGELQVMTQMTVMLDTDVQENQDSQLKAVSSKWWAVGNFHPQNTCNQASNFIC